MTAKKVKDGADIPNSDSEADNLNSIVANNILKSYNMFIGENKADWRKKFSFLNELKENNLLCILYLSKYKRDKILDSIKVGLGSGKQRKSISINFRI